jgi:hypothetical protein
MDAHGAIVDWRPSPNRRRLVLRWTFRCLVAVAAVAGAWSLRDRYPRIDLSGEPRRAWPRQLKRSAPGGSSFPQLRRFNSKVN